MKKPTILGSLFTLIFIVTLAYLIGQSSIYWYRDGMLMRFIGGHLLLIASYLFTLHYAIVIAQLNKLTDKSKDDDSNKQ